MEKRPIVIVTGADGQVATEYQLSTSLANWDFLFLRRTDMDITKPEQIKKVFDHFSPDACVNLAAYTNVDKAEKEETQQAYDINTLGPLNLAIACKEKGIPLIHFSTDYVFDGAYTDKPYTEDSPVNPLSNYGRTKLLGEQMITKNHDWYYIIRTSWVYSNHSTSNFFVKMLNLAQERYEINVVQDQWGSPTSSKELCRVIDTILQNLDKNLTGVYHFSGMGRTNWKDFATEIFTQSKVNVLVKGTSTASWPSIVTRPANSYMSSNKFASVFSYQPMHWKNALKEILSDRKVLPIKVGDNVYLENEECIIVSTDWLKRVARVSLISNMNQSTEIPFEILEIRAI